MTAVWFAPAVGAQEPDPLGPARALESVFVDAIARAEGAVVAICAMTRGRPLSLLIRSIPSDPSVRIRRMIWSRGTTRRSISVPA